MRSLFSRKPADLACVFSQRCAHFIVVWWMVCAWISWWDGFIRVPAFHAGQAASLTGAHLRCRSLFGKKTKAKHVHLFHMLTTLRFKKIYIIEPGVWEFFHLRKCLLELQLQMGVYLIGYAFVYHFDDAISKKLTGISLSHAPLKKKKAWIMGVAACIYPSKLTFWGVDVP